MTVHITATWQFCKNERKTSKVSHQFLVKLPKKVVTFVPSDGGEQTPSQTAALSDGSQVCQGVSSHSRPLPASPEETVSHTYSPFRLQHVAVSPETLIQNRESRRSWISWKHTCVTQS